VRFKLTRPPRTDWAAPPGSAVARTGPGELDVRFDPAVTSAAAVIAAVLGSAEVSDLSIVEPDLEPVIRQIYGDRPKNQREALRS
jgi:ABC-2 type transport system ATP-binding protein